MKKTILIFSLTLITVCPNVCGQLAVTPKDAGRAAQVWIHTYYPSLSGNSIFIDSLVYKEGQPLLFEVVTDSISVLVSGNKACLPVLGTYRMAEGRLIQRYKKGDLPCTLFEYMTDYVDQIEFSYRSDTIVPYYLGLWDSIINEQISSSQPVTFVGPLIRTHWGQSNSNDARDAYAYNYYAPGISGECEHAVAGCVAVAMAQIMNYWQTPLLSYSLERQFDWCNMPNELIVNNNNYEMQRDAVAHLIRECGRSVNMQYGCDGSSASTQDAPDAFVEFGYSDDAHYSKRKHYNSDNWKNKLKNHIDWGFPVMYRGNGSGGHSFVCDGYNSNRYFHFNWGWTGISDDYFSVEELTPGYYNSSHNFSNNQGAVFYIHPENNDIELCDISLPLDLYYMIYYLFNSLGDWDYDNYEPLPPMLPKPYEITPQTMTTLTSAHSSFRADFRTIPAGQTATYRAHEEIILQDGFEAEWGSDFTAEIVPCPACEEPAIHPIHPVLDSLFPLVQTEQDSLDVVGDEMYGHLEDFGLTRAEVFPNPTTGELTVGTDGMAEAIVVYNAAGRPVGGWDILSQGKTWLTLDLSTLPHGVYIVVVRTETGTAAARIVKQ